MRPIVRHQGRVRLFEGDSREVLKRLPDNSVDSCSCDPPYALVSVIQRFGGDNAAPAKFGTDGLYARASAGFMGQKWDTGETAFAVEFWREVLRVLKPGGHVVAFGGTRTYHHLAMAIEMAGFEIRDQLAWTYGSGFPKSHDVAKGIDKSDAAVERRRRSLRFTEWMRSTGVTIAEINDATGSLMGSHYLTDKEQPAVPTETMFTLLRPLLPPPPDFVEELVAERTVESENFKAREVIGRETKARSTSGRSALPTVGGETVYQSWDLTAPATSEAAEWEGWGTALKPAWEPIVLARKPLSEGTVAANVLRWGTGALNIDGCRILTGDNLNGGAYSKATTKAKSGSMRGPLGVTGKDYERPEGRFPANLLHDGSPEVLDFLPDGAARFFYCAKASKADREEGLEHLPLPEGKTRRNIHPTVKPTSVMAYFTRLITPPGGVVLDPFMGSGSTGKACMVEGFRFIGIDAQPEFIPIAEARIAFAAAKHLPAPEPDPDFDPEPMKELEYEGY